VTVRGSRSDPHRVSEKEWSATVKDLLETFGWAINHVYPLKTESGGWRTSTTAKGWPDWMALRGEYILALELKGYTARGDATRFKPGQRDWLLRFAAIPTGRAWVLRPTDSLAEIMSWVRYPQDAPRIFGWDGSGG
jgi:hypothetical protein